MRKNIGRFIFGLACSACYLLCVKNCKIVELKRECTVLSHALTEHSGSTKYHTIGRCSDGNIIDNNLIENYALPVGDKFTDKYNNTIVIDTAKW